MTTRKFSGWKNLTIIILGGAGVSTWMLGACDSMDDRQAPTAARSPAQASLEAVNQAPDGYVVAPGGVVIHKDCVYEVPDGAVAHADLSVTRNGKTIAQYTACTHKRFRLARPTDSVVTAAGDSTRVVSALSGTGNGWVENSQAQTTSTMFNHMDVGYWQVPSVPASTGQTLYFKIALQTDDGNTIMSPALSYGNWQACNNGFGGYCWTFANWWQTWTGPNAGIFHSADKVANVGDQMWGSLDMTNQVGSNQYWTLIIKDVTTGATTTTGAVLAVPSFRYAFPGVLEAYGVTSCSQFPGGSSASTYFPGPNLYQGTSFSDRNVPSTSWYVKGPADYSWAGPSCGFSQWVGSTGLTYLYY